MDLIVEVFKVQDWYSKERKYNSNAKKYKQTYTGYGFNGEVTEASIRDLYVNKSIAKIKKKGFAGVIIFSETLEKMKREDI